ncbi:hypothetical protein BBJ28_00022076 [Nothophytophthora sp. Chile5]|nr:hypothetical protein BBJ28_00022076 [Nothophytophthora sp. Chile5]
MARRDRVSLLVRSSGTLERLEKPGVDAESLTPSASWAKAVESSRLLQLSSSVASAPKRLQQQDSNQNPKAVVRAPSSVVKRVTKVPKLVFGQSKRRGRWSISNQFINDDNEDEAARQVNAGVYLLENTKTGHRFFGTTWDLRNAEAQSFHDLQGSLHPHRALSTCFQLYGEAASGIRFRILERVSPPSSPKPSSHHGNRTQRRKRPSKRRSGGDSDDDSFDVRAMERKLAARLRFHQRRVVRRAAFKIVRRFLVLPVLRQAWPRWRRATESCTRVEQLAAGVELQRVARGYLARMLVLSIRRDRGARILQRFMRRSHFTLACRRRVRAQREADAACVIQRAMREFVARRRSRRRRDGIRRWLAARKLQAQIRGHLARLHVGRVRIQNTRERAAVQLQRMTRGLLARRRALRRRQNATHSKAARLIQKTWRGHSTRAKLKLQRQLDGLLPRRRLVHGLSVEELQDEAARRIQRVYSRWQTRRLDLQQAKALTIRLAYRNYVAKKFGWAATTLRLETTMATRIQHAGRRWVFRRALRRVVTQMKREKAALTLQCRTRQRQALQKTRVLREQTRRDHAARCIQTAWRVYWLLFQARKELDTRRRERAARCIQAKYRQWQARCEFLAIRELARRDRAATSIQCLYRSRQARRERLRREVVRRLGACENCRSQLAVVYHFAEQLELCDGCRAAWPSDGAVEMEVMDVHTYRRVQRPLVSAQRAYRAFQQRLVHQFGTCSLCEKQAVRMSCETCLQGHGLLPDKSEREDKAAAGLLFCHSCDALFHQRKQSTSAAGLAGHKRKTIERVAIEEQAAVVLQKHFRRFAHRHTLFELRFARQSAAARRIQTSYRRHYQRRLTRLLCAAWRQQQLREASATLLLQRVARGYLARCALRRLKRQRASAIAIQRVVRRRQARRVYDAAVVIQSHTRGWFARRLAAVKRQERLQALRDAAARCIQRLVRGFLVRRRVLHAKQLAAAIRLQSRWRGHVARCELRSLKREKQRLFHAQVQQQLCLLAARIAEEERVAATKIQSLARTRQARQELYKRRFLAARRARETLRSRAVALEAASAACIQRHVRERLTNAATKLRLPAQCCARRFLSRRKVQRVRLEKRAAVRIQRAFRYSRAKRRLARLVGVDDVDDVAAAAPKWVELFDEASGYVYYYHRETGQSVWERPSELDMSTGTPEDTVTAVAEEDAPVEWVEYWDENVGASYFYNVKTGEATWTTPVGYTSSNQEDTLAADAWPLESGGMYHTLPSRSKLPPPAPNVARDYAEDAGNQSATSPDAAAAEYYAYYGYDYSNQAAGDHGDGVEGPVDTEYGINYKIYLTQLEQQQQQQQQEEQQAAPTDQETQQAEEHEDQTASDSKEA